MMKHTLITALLTIIGLVSHSLLASCGGQDEGVAGAEQPSVAPGENDGSSEPTPEEEFAAWGGWEHPFGEHPGTEPCGAPVLRGFDCASGMAIDNDGTGMVCICPP